MNGHRPDEPELVLTGPQMEALLNAFCSAFDLKTLDQMLQFRLDKDRPNIVASADLRTVTFDLLMASRREGWLSDLIRAACAYVPGNPALKKFVEENPRFVGLPRTADLRGQVLPVIRTRWFVFGLAAATLLAVAAVAFFAKGCREPLDGSSNADGNKTTEVVRLSEGTGNVDGHKKTETKPWVIGFGTEPSTDRDRPTALSSNEIRATVVQKERTRYYFQFTAGPGELITTLDFTAGPSGYLQYVSVTLFEQKTKPLGERLSINIAHKENKRVERRSSLAKRQTVILQIETGSMERDNGGQFLLLFEGAAWINPQP